MKDQVLSIEQMQHLKELGVETSKASVYWARMCHGSGIRDESKSKWFLSLQKDFQVCGFMAYEVIPTFTIGDMLEMMPTLYPTRINGERKLVHTRQVDSGCTYMPSIYLFDDYWHACYIDNDGFEEIDFLDNSITNACYKLLCWLAENKLLGKEEKHG